LKAGVIGRFIPNSVIKGMLAAIGILLILKQLPHFVGYDADPEGDEAFFQPDGENTFSEILLALNRFSPLAFLIATCSMCFLLLFEWKKIKSTRWSTYLSGPLVAVIVGVLINEFLLPDAHLLSLRDEHLVQIPSFCTSADLFLNLPRPSWQAFLNLNVWSVAIVIAIVASLESLLSLEAVDKLDPLKRISSPNRELIAQGAGNLVSGFLGGLPVTSVIVRSSANVNAGAKSKFSAILHGFLILASLMLIPDVLNMIPKASLASILIFTGYKLAPVSLFKNYWKKGKEQFIPFFITVVAIIFSDLLMGIAIGILSGLFFVLKSNYRSAIVFVKDENNYLLRFSREVSFLNKSILLNYFEQIPEGSAVLIDPLRNEFMDQDIIETVNDFIQAAPSREIKIYIKRDPSKEKELFVDPLRLEIN
jgi:MFS superfamily sulfate permease-like transporter